MKRALYSLIAVASVCSIPVLSAHHSFAETYLAEKEVKVDGQLIQFLFRNPHSFLQVDAPDDKGVMQRWSIEWAAAGSLKGVRGDTLKYGDHIIVTGNPGRVEQDHRMRMLSLL